MSVRIERLSIRDFGPLRHFVLTPSDVTVVFGRNEAGKTSCIDALVRALRERVRSGNRKLVDGLREGPGFEGAIELSLAPADGGPLLALLREHPSLARLFIVRDGDAALEGGRGWLDAIRGKLIGIDVRRVADRVRRAASLTPTLALREARQDERDRLAERLARLEGFLADIPAIGGMLEEIHGRERERAATRRRLEQLRSAERYERYRIAREAAETVEAAERALAGLERYGEADLEAWREAVSALREAAALAKSAEQEVHGLEGQLASAREELRQRDRAIERAAAAAEDCRRRELADLLARARAAKASGEIWSLWRIPLVVLALLLLALATGAGIQAFERAGTPTGVSMAVAAGAFALGGLLGGLLAMVATSRIRRGTALAAEALAACGAALPRVGTLEECEAQLAEVTRRHERALIERSAGAERSREIEARLEVAQQGLADRQRRLEEAQRRIADIRARVGLASLDQLEERLRARAAASSRRDEALRALETVSGAASEPVRRRRLVEELAVEDPGVAADRAALAEAERSLEVLDAELLGLRGQLAERRDRALAALGLSEVGVAQEEAERLRLAVAGIDREAAAARLCLEALEDLAADIDRPLREALGAGPCAAGAYLGRLTGGAYGAVVLDGDGRLAVERADGTTFTNDALSRGARDQLALAVRLSLVRRLLGEPAFLVLDDAFLSSDPDRRESLAVALSELAAEGWQVLYFTFDPALRDRLAAIGARVVELSPPVGRAAAAGA